MAVPTLDAFQVIADPSRRHILHLLTEEDELSINAIAEHFDMSRPAVSKHVKILYNAGFITIEDKGRERYCVLQEDGFDELRDWLMYFDKFWHSRLRKLGRVMKKKHRA